MKSLCYLLAILGCLGALSARGEDAGPLASNATDASARLDSAIEETLRERGIEASDPSTEEVFVRRVHLDVLGTLPTVEEVQAYLEDRAPEKRTRLIDRVLAREEYADYWAMKWCDLLRVKAEFPINLWPNAAQAYHRWIRSSLEANLPLDRFSRELLTASGSNFRVPQVNFYRALPSREPDSIARAVALAFLGARAETWPKERLEGLSVFFSRLRYKSTDEWKEEIVSFDPFEDAGKDPVPAELTAVLPDGTRVAIPRDRDPRGVFADWLLQPENRAFPRNVANRAWSWFLGRGIVHEPDDIRDDNPASCPKLLDVLAADFVAHGYDLKQLFRTILRTRAYGRSCISRARVPEEFAGLAYYPLRRLEAEVLIDALNRITGSGERYTSAIPEPYTFVPEETRSIALADGSVGSAFLELFGRPPRDTGLECERTNAVTAPQRLHLLNSSHVQRKIEQSPRLQALAKSRARPKNVVEELYLSILSRRPTGEELRIAVAYLQAAGPKRREAIVDLAWALLNGTEFLHRH